MNRGEKEITKMLVEHLEKRQANKTFLQSKGIAILNNDFMMMSQIQDKCDKEYKEMYNMMKDELSIYGYSEFRFLGAGAQGYTILAKDNQTQVRHVIKGVVVKDSKGMVSDKIKQNLDNEIQMRIKCKGSPHTLNFVQFIEGNRMCFIVLNECKGTLQNLVEQEGGRLDEISAIKYSKDIAEGLNHIHQSGFLVQDMKLDNILIDYNNNAVVADLGLGNKIQSDSYYGEDKYMGNMLYCAPEVQDYYQAKYVALKIQVAQKPSKSSEAFSLGYIMYGLLFGLTEVARKVPTKDEVLQFPNGFSQFTYQNGLEKIMLGLTKFIPKERISVYDTFLMLKGIVSIVLNLEDRFNEALIGQPQALRQIYKNQIEIIQQSEKSYLPIMANEKMLLQSTQQIPTDKASMNQIEQLKNQLTLIQKENQVLKYQEIQISSQLKDYKNIVDKLKQGLQKQSEQLTTQKLIHVSSTQNQKEIQPNQNQLEGPRQCENCKKVHQLKNQPRINKKIKETLQKNKQIQTSFYSQNMHIQIIFNFTQKLTYVLFQFYILIQNIHFSLNIQWTFKS